MKYIKPYIIFKNPIVEGYGGRRGPSTMDLDEIQTVSDIPERYHIRYYENRELTPHEKELVKNMFRKYTSVVIPEDVIMDRLYDIKDMNDGIEIEIRNKVFCGDTSIDMKDIDTFDLHDLIEHYGILCHCDAIDKPPYSISSIDITFPIEEDQKIARESGEDYTETLVDGEAFHEACGMVNTTIKDFFESYAKCEVECESYNTTIDILIAYK